MLNASASVNRDVAGMLPWLSRMFAWRMDLLFNGAA